MAVSEQHICHTEFSCMLPEIKLEYDKKKLYL